MFVVAWLAFAMNGVLQHCCKVFSGVPENAIRLASVPPGLSGETVNSPGDVGHDEDYCSQLLSVDTVAPPAELLLPEFSRAHVIVTSYIETNSATITAIPPAHPYRPPPSSRVYLSTQRLRI